MQVSAYQTPPSSLKYSKPIPRRHILTIPMQCQTQTTESDLWKPTEIPSFGSEEDGYWNFREPLVFQWRRDPETDWFVIRGIDDYRHIMSYGKTLKEAMWALQGSILPVLWDYAQNNDGSHSHEDRLVNEEFLRLDMN